MTTRSRPTIWLVAAALATAAAPGRARGQDTPLYRDPSPAEGPRVEGPLLAPFPPRPDVAPPPPGVLGPFQPANSGLPDVAPEIPRDPLLGIPPLPPPQPAMPLPPLPAEGDVQVRRKTAIRPPKGMLGRCHDWIHDIFLGRSREKSAVETAAKHGLSTWFWHAESPEPEALHRRFKWPTWPLREGP